MSVYIAGIILLIVKLLVVLVALLLLAAYLIWVERRLLGFLQIRLGPNRAGFQGLLQPIADAVKLLTKEDFMPAGADKYIFLYAPVVVAATAILIFAVIPFARGWTCFTSMPYLLWRFTALPWAAGPPTPSTASWGRLGARPR
jgi:NADH-quinone oxidoreductase subunit H